MGNKSRVSVSLKLAVSIIFCQAIGGIGAFFTIPAIDTWYKFLKKPMFTPPDWVFMPVWIFLFLLMGVAMFIVWAKPTAEDKTPAAVTFVIQAGLNSIWPILFFSFHSPLAALIEIMALWIMVIFNAFVFWKVSKTAGYLLIPYVVWITFAGIINAYVLVLN